MSDLVKRLRDFTKSEAVRVEAADRIEALESELAAERDLWKTTAQEVIAAHDEALAYVYDQLRRQGVASIPIPDAAVAEIKAVNALRALLQTNTQASGGTSAAP